MYLSDSNIWTDAGDMTVDAAACTGLKQTRVVDCLVTRLVKTLQKGG